MKNLKENARLLLIVPSVLMTLITTSYGKLHGDAYNGKCNVSVPGGHRAAESCSNENVTCDDDGTCSITLNGVKHSGKVTLKKVKHRLKKKLKPMGTLAPKGIVKSNSKQEEMFKFTQLRP